MVKFQKKAKYGGMHGLMHRLSQLKKRRIYVGIPQNESSRKGEPINNAELLFIHTNGSPIKGIPARPVLEPAINEHKERISASFKEIYAATAVNNQSERERAIHRTGLIAQNACREWFTNPKNNWSPNNPATIRRKGSDRPLIDTGELRKSITYVVRDVT